MLRRVSRVDNRENVSWSSGHGQIRYMSVKQRVISIQYVKLSYTITGPAVTHPATNGIANAVCLEGCPGHVATGRKVSFCVVSCQIS